MYDTTKQFNVTATNVGPYMGISFDKSVTYDNGRTMRILVCGAYNAYGLIGPEHNGIVVLDEDDMTVVADRLEEIDSGYFGPTDRQLFIARSIAKPGQWGTLCALVNNSNRHRVVL